MSKLKVLITKYLVLISAVQFAAAQSFDKDYIEQLAVNVVKQQYSGTPDEQLTITANEIDPRIIIRPCQQALVANIPENSGGRNVNVKISCFDSTPWHMFIPVKVTQTVPVLVAARPISKGTTLDHSNVEVIQKDIYKLRRSSIDNADIVIGARAKRSLSKGTPISMKSICMVCRGDKVTIVAQGETFAIKTTGVALRDGSIGDQITIENERSGRKIVGQVDAINKVIINL